MTFINLDSRGKVTAEWGVGRRKQGKQQKTLTAPYTKPVPVTHHLTTMLWQVTLQLVPVPISPPELPGPHRALHVLTAESVLALMFPPESPRLRLYTPSSILPHYTLLSSLVPCTPIPTHNPRPWGICTDSALECQAQESDTQHAGCGQRVWGPGWMRYRGNRVQKGTAVPQCLLCPSAPQPQS